jgi:response regulator of citrate/malate metabolism
MRSMISTLLFPDHQPQLAAENPAKESHGSSRPLAVTKALEVLRSLDYPVTVRQLAELAGVSAGSAQRAIKMSAEQTGAVRVVYADTGRSRTVAMFSAKGAA